MQLLKKSATAHMPFLPNAIPQGSPMLPSLLTILLGLFTDVISHHDTVGASFNLLSFDKH